MKNRRTTKFEVIFAAIFFIVVCLAIVLTVNKGDEKNSGLLTTENYSKYMKVYCRLGNGYVVDNTKVCTYYVIVDADSHYALDNVTISYSLLSDGADLPDNTFTATIGAGQIYLKEYKDSFTVTLNDDLTWSKPTLEIVVKSVSGTYKYTA